MKLFTVGGVFVLVAGVVGGAAASGRPDDLCHDTALTRQQQDLCIQQIATAQTLSEQKAIQAKYRKLITAQKPK